MPAVYLYNKEDHRPKSDQFMCIKQQDAIGLALPA